MKDKVKLNGYEPDGPSEGPADKQGNSPKGSSASNETPGTAESAATIEKAETLVDAQLDKSIELSFPASDPIASPPMPNASNLAPCRDPFEDLLDEAISLTFPASDPIAVSAYAGLLAAAPTQPKAQDNAVWSNTGGG